MGTIKTLFKLYAISVIAKNLLPLVERLVCIAIVVGVLAWLYRLCGMKF